MATIGGVARSRGQKGGLSSGSGVQVIVTSPYLLWRKVRPLKARARGLIKAGRSLRWQIVLPCLGVNGAQDGRAEEAR